MATNPSRFHPAKGVLYACRQPSVVGSGLSGSVPIYTYHQWDTVTIGNNRTIRVETRIWRPTRRLAP